MCIVIDPIPTRQAIVIFRSRWNGGKFSERVWRSGEPKVLIFQGGGYCHPTNKNHRLNRWSTTKPSSSCYGKHYVYLGKQYSSSQSPPDTLHFLLFYFHWIERWTSIVVCCGMLRLFLYIFYIFIILYCSYELGGDLRNACNIYARWLQDSTQVNTKQLVS